MIFCVFALTFASVAANSLLEPDDGLHFMQLAIGLNKHSQHNANMANKTIQKTDAEPAGWCEPWCHKHTEDWKKKCSWLTMKCSSCPGCIRDNVHKLRRAVHDAVHQHRVVTSAGACMPWCHGHTKTWGEKCTWITHTCSACPSCSHHTVQKLRSALHEAIQKPEQEVVFHCHRWCLEHSADWNTKCAWKTIDCRGCIVCAQNRSKSLLQVEHPAKSGREQPAQSCEKWCHKHKSDWSAKCAWKTKRCSACDSCAKLAPRSFHQAVQQATRSGREKHGGLSRSQQQEFTGEAPKQSHGQQAKKHKRLSISLEQHSAKVQKIAKVRDDGKVVVAFDLNSYGELEEALLASFQRKGLNMMDYEIGDTLPELRDRNGELLSDTDEPTPDQFPLRVKMVLIRVEAPEDDTKKRADETGEFVNEATSLGDVPSTPGCYVYTPSGCQDRQAGPKARQWTLDPKDGANSSEAICQSRREKYNQWCNVSDTRMLFIAAGTDRKVFSAAEISSKAVEKEVEQESQQLLQAEHKAERLLAKELLRQLIAPDVAPILKEEHNAATELAHNLSKRAADQLAAELLKEEAISHLQERKANVTLNETFTQRRKRAKGKKSHRHQLEEENATQFDEAYRGTGKRDKPQQLKDCLRFGAQYTGGRTESRSLSGVLSHIQCQAECLDDEECAFFTWLPGPKTCRLSRRGAFLEKVIWEAYAAPRGCTDEKPVALQQTEKEATETDKKATEIDKKAAPFQQTEKEPAHRRKHRGNCSGVECEVGGHVVKPAALAAERQTAIFGDTVLKSLTTPKPVVNPPFAVSNEAWADVRRTRQSLFHIDGRKFLFCSVPMVADTEFFKLVLRLAGWNASHWEDVLLNYDPAREHMWFDIKKDRDRFNQIFNETSPGWFKAVFLRDPVNRFVAAYESKLKAGYFRTVLGHSEDMKIDEFVAQLEAGAISWKTDAQLRPQSATCGLNDTIELYDFIGDFDALDADAHMMLAAFGGEEMAQDMLDHGWGLRPRNQRLFRTKVDAINKTKGAELLQVESNASLVHRIKKLYAMDYDLIRRAKNWTHHRAAS